MEVSASHHVYPEVQAADIARKDQNAIGLWAKPTLENLFIEMKGVLTDEMRDVQ